MNNFENIPTELKALRQWVMWKLEKDLDKNGNVVIKDGKEHFTKPLYHINNYKVSHSNPKQWSKFEAVRDTFYKNGKGFAGIGFVFSKTDNYVGIDFDDCFDSSGTMSPDAKYWIEKFNSYTEYSQSKNGIHILVKGKLPDRGRKKPEKGYEIYEKERYFALTGDLLDAKYSLIEERQEIIDEFFLSVFKEEEPKAKPAPVLNNNISLDAENIIKLLEKEKNGKAARLLAGDTSEHGGDDSGADLALCNKIAFYTQNEAEIDSIFRQSGLMRDKWDERHGADTYGNMTIKKALAGLTGTYDPNHNKTSLSCPIENIPLPTDADDPEYKKPSKKKSQKPVIKKEEIPSMVIYSDMWNSRKLVQQHGENIRYCDEWKKWIVWNGKYWKKDATNNEKLRQIAKQTIRSFYERASHITDDTERSKFVNHIRTSENLNKIKAMVELSQSEPDITIGEVKDCLDKNKWLLNVKNGTLDLKTMKILPHDRQNGVSGSF